MIRARGGWQGILVVVLLAAGIAYRAYGQKPGDTGFPYGDLTEVTLKGRLISLGDELARKYGAKVPPGTPAQWGFATPEGALFTFLETDVARKLVAAQAEGPAVELQARRFPRSNLLEVTAFKWLPARAVERRFHCDICNIDTQDWGPCVCCGKEFVLVREAP
jgi:hypothetical protein